MYSNIPLVFSGQFNETKLLLLLVSTKKLRSKQKQTMYGYDELSTLVNVHVELPPTVRLSHVTPSCGPHVALAADLTTRGLQSVWGPCGVRVGSEWGPCGVRVADSPPSYLLAAAAPRKGVRAQPFL